MPDPSRRYKVQFTKTAQKDYDSIKDAKLIRGVNRIVEDLKDNPYQFKKLSGPFSYLRSAKTFSFRVLYQIQGGQLLVLVVAVEPRKDAYR